MKLLWASIASIAALPASAAEWRFAPRMNTGVDYSDNPRLIPDNHDSHVAARGELAADLSVTTERSTVSFAPRYAYARVNDDPLLDRNDQYATLTARRRFETATWTASSSYTRDTTITSEFGLTGLQDVNRVHEAVNVSLSPVWQISERTQASVQLYGLDSSYENAELTGLVDYTYGAAAASGSYVMTENTIAGIQVSVGELEVIRHRYRSRDIDASISLDWQLNEHWRTRLAYGPTRIESGLGDSDGYAFSSSIARQNQRSSLRFAVERDVTPTGRGVLVTRDQASFTSGYAMTPRTSWSLSAQAIRTVDAIDFPGAPEQENEFVRLESTVRWQCAEHWSVVLVGSGRYLKYEQRTDHARGFAVSVGFAWNGLPWSMSW